MGAGIGAGSNVAGQVGTRPGPHGMHVISSGLDDLDGLYGSGGVPLGTLTIFSDDGWTRHGDLLLKYFVSEGLAVHHSVGIILPNSLAETATVDEYILKTLSKSDLAVYQKDEALTKDGEKDESKLRIAWQYEKYRNPTAMHAQTMAAQGQRPALGSSRNQINTIRTKSKWSHDFDIAKPPPAKYTEDILKLARQKSDVRILSINPSDGFVSQTIGRVTEFIDSISRKEFASTSGSVGRIIIPHLGNLAWDDDTPGRGEERLVNLLTQLRSIVQQRSNISIMMTVPMRHLNQSQSAKIRHVSDAFFDLESVEDTSQVVNLSKDSKTVAGHMEILKLPAFGAIKAPLPQITSYIIRNKRRRLVIEAVEVDPDAEQAWLEKEAQELVASKPPAHSIDF